MELDSKQLIFEIRKDLLEAKREGSLEVLKPNESRTAPDVSPEWQAFFAEIGAFSLSNSTDEFFFEDNYKEINFLMPRRVDLSGQSKFGWFCVINSDGQPTSVWYHSDWMCYYGFADLSQWIKAILGEHRDWMNVWNENGSPDPELEEDKWLETIEKFDSKSLESAICGAAKQKKTVIRRDELLDFRDAKFGDHLDFNWNLSAAGDDMFHCQKHTIMQRLMYLISPFTGIHPNDKRNWKA